MIEWSLHTEPYTENPSKERKPPEGFFGYPPPLIDRLEFVDPHDRVGEDIDDEEVEEHRLSFKTKNGFL